MKSSPMENDDMSYFKKRLPGKTVSTDKNLRPGIGIDQIALPTCPTCELANRTA